MDGNIFGSVLDLSALLGEGGGDIFGKGIGDLADLDNLELPEDFTCKASTTSSLSGLGYDASNDEADTFPCTAAMQFPSQLPATQMWPASAASPSPAPFKQTAPDSSQNSAALLSQLLAAIQSSAPPKAETILQQGLRNQSAPMPEPKPAANMSLPSLTAPQQQALQTIMSLGSLGSTPEGKKVRRMLSNRESARRSRHRKQAHVHTLEEKVSAIEAENHSLKASLSRMTAQELHHATERMQLQTEIATLHNKIARMEQGASCGVPLKAQGAGSDESTKGESFSFDSCCASRPGKRNIVKPELEFCSKKSKT